MNTIENTDTLIQKPVVLPINPWREGVLFVLIGTSTITVGTVFSIVSLLLPILVVPFFITSIPTGISGATHLNEFIQVFFGDVASALLCALILGFIAHWLHIFNKALFQTLRVFDNKFKWMDPYNIVKSLNNWKTIIKTLAIVALVSGLIFVIMTQSGMALTWQEWGSRGE